MSQKQLKNEKVRIGMDLLDFQTVRHTNLVKRHSLKKNSKSYLKLKAKFTMGDRSFTLIPISSIQFIFIRNKEFITLS